MVEKDFFILSKLLHILIKKGKKSYALKVFLLVLKKLKENAEVNHLSPTEVIYKALLNVRPLLHIKKVRKSSKVFYLPKLINTEQKINVSLHWLLKSVENRKERKFEDRLTQEILDCFFGKGSTMSKKQNLYDTILVNRPFLHLLIYK